MGQGAGAASILAVLGAGTMGRGIAQLAAQAGFLVEVFDPDAAALASARAALDEVFRMLHGKGRLAEEPDTVSRRIGFHTELRDLAAADWVLEAAPEDLALKQDLFKRAAEACPNARLATNTSTLSVTSIASATGRPADLIGIHFFNPAPLMRLVEVVPGAATHPSVTEAAVELARRLGRTPVVAQDRPGFIVNRVARPYYGEALRLAGEGVPHASIDLAMRAAGFRMGPFELLDLIGLDVNLAATQSVYRAFFEEPRYRPHPMQQTLVRAGWLGRKSGRGFYRYDGTGQGVPAPMPRPAEAADPEPVLVLGDGQVARWLKRRMHVTSDARDAAAVLDARIDLASKVPLAESEGRPLATLVWGHSASRAVAAYGRAVVGFSLLPPPEQAQDGGGPLESGQLRGGRAGGGPLGGGRVEGGRAAGGPPGGVRTDGGHLAGARTDGRQADGPGPVIELCAPEGANPVVLGPLKRVLASHGLATLEVPDRAGGLAFRIVALLVNEAVSALSEGLATADAIDVAMRLGVNYPHGPLAWGEILGLEDLERALRGLHQELGAQRFAPQPLLTRLAAVGAPGFRTAS